MTDELRDPSTLPTYSGAALDVALTEATRARATLAARIASLRGRSGILIGASGIAAGLISTAATNAWFLLPVTAFLIAAILGVLSIAPGPSRANTAATVLTHAEGKVALDMKLWVLEKIASESAAEERRTKWPARFDRLGTWVFVGAIVLVLIVSATALTKPAAETPPMKIEIVEG